MMTKLNAENLTLSTLFEENSKTSTSGSDALLLSDDLTQTIAFVNFSILCTSVATFGVFANIVNIIVFVKLGFNDTTNVSLFTLAMADMSSLVFLAWIGACFNPYLKRLPLPFEPKEVSYLTGGIPRQYFTRVAGWVTSVVAIERCVCVLKPMQVKLIFTRQRIVIAIIFITIIAFVSLVPVYVTTRLSWKLDLETNRTYLGLAFMQNRHKIDRLTFALGVTVSLSAFTVVTSCTIILGWSLVKQSRWRNKSAVDMTLAMEGRNQTLECSDRKNKKLDKKPEMSNRDRQAVRTVTFIAAMFIVCLTPNVLNMTLMSIFPEYNNGAKFQNIFTVMWSFAQMMEGICSSANIFVYYLTSTKYKEKFKHQFNCFIPVLKKIDISRYIIDTDSK